MRIGSEVRSWEEGRCNLLDDSFEHEVRTLSTAANISVHGGLQADPGKDLCASLGIRCGTTVMRPASCLKLSFRTPT
jgi:hypothetical protein